MKKNVVYKYTNVINNKVYIGRTMQTIKNRAGKNGNNYKECTKFWHAICKYGWNNFTLEILADNLTYEESIELEKCYIQSFHSNKQEYGYNLYDSEPAHYGSIMAEETKQKMKYNAQHRSEEYRKHLSEGHMGQRAWNKGLKTGPLTELQKAKFSEARKGNLNSMHVAVRNIDTGEVFRSGAAAGRSVGCSSEAIFASIKENRLCKGFKFERVCE